MRWRCLNFGAHTPWHRVRWARGRWHEGGEAGDKVDRVEHDNSQRARAFEHGGAHRALGVLGDLDGDAVGHVHAIRHSRGAQCARGRTPRW